MRRTDTKKLAVLAMLGALAYIVVMVGRIPVVLFLDYEPKDIVIAIGGFIYGPLSAFAISFVVSVVEMFTISETGYIGAAMNIIASCAFACTAAAIYKRKHTLAGATIGLTAGGLLMTAVMLLWNYLIIPIYMGLPRAQVAEMLIPVFLPFNLLKGGLNAAITMLLYKPIRTTLSKSKLIAPPAETVANSKINLGAVMVSLFVIGTCVLIILVFQGHI